MPNLCQHTQTSNTGSAMKTRTCSTQLSKVVRDSACVSAGLTPGAVLPESRLGLAGQAAGWQMEPTAHKILDSTEWRGPWNLPTVLKSKGLEGYGLVGPSSSWGSPFVPSLSCSLGEKLQRRVLGENTGPIGAPPGRQGDWESGGPSFLSVGV